jgi:hypothetical protein
LSLLPVWICVVDEDIFNLAISLKLAAVLWLLRIENLLFSFLVNELLNEGS